MGVPGVSVVGMVGGEVFGAQARRALERAELLVGSPRHLAHVARAVERVELCGPIPLVLEKVAEARAEARPVCILASGDPGFFGIGRIVAERFGDDAVVLPAPSSVSLACAAVGWSWDDADVVSVHGRPAADALPRVASSPKVAVLTGPGHPPDALGRSLLAHGCPPRRVVVASRLGEADESFARTDLGGLASGHFDPMSVVLLEAAEPAIPAHLGARSMNVSWGAPIGGFEHRDGMITKPEVRAVVLGKLALGPAGLLWDLGAGSGSVGIEAATVQPALDVYAVERSAPDAARIVRNASAFGVAERIAVVVGEAPQVLAGLPRPDRVVVGGGGLSVVEAAWSRLAPGGVLVALFVVLDRAARAAQLPGEMVQLHVDRAVPIGDAGIRFEPANPVFVCWGRR